MILTKTPFRISLAGGGTDLAAFYAREYGAVVSFTIDKYVYIAIHEYFEKKIVLKYSRTEVVDGPDDVQHPLIRECLKLAEMHDPVEITSFADIPSSGSGLGSSSAFCVGLIKALLAHRGRNASAEACARGACQVEIERLGEPIGKQDQYAAAYGGLGYIRFNPDGSVHVEPILMPRPVRERLEANLVMFYTGLTRKAGSVLETQKARTESDADTFRRLLRMRELADELREELQRGRIEAVGESLRKGWELKRELASGITTGEIDAYYERGLKAGAAGGKLLGAGGGGFLLFYCDQERQPALLEELSELRAVPFRFDMQGTRVIYVGD